MYINLLRLLTQSEEGQYGLQCGSQVGGQPPVTLAELTFDGKQNWYDISMVDGFNLKTGIYPLQNEKCSQINCANSIDREKCPELLRVYDEDDNLSSCQSICKALDDQKALARNPELQALREIRVAWAPNAPVMEDYTFNLPAKPPTCSYNLEEVFGSPSLKYPAYYPPALNKNTLTNNVKANRRRDGRWVPSYCEWNGRDCKYLKDLYCCSAGYDQNLDANLKDPSLPLTGPEPLKGCPDKPVADTCEVDHYGTYGMYVGPANRSMSSPNPQDYLWSAFNCSLYIEQPTGGPANPENNCNFQMSTCARENWPTPKSIREWCARNPHLVPDSPSDAGCNLATIFRKLGGCADAYSWQFDDLTAGKSCLRNVTKTGAGTGKDPWKYNGDDFLVTFS